MLENTSIDFVEASDRQSPVVFGGRLHEIGQNGWIGGENRWVRLTRRTLHLLMDLCRNEAETMSLEVSPDCNALNGQE